MTQLIQANRSWAEHFAAFAVTASKKSKDSTRVGAVLVGSDGSTLLTAFNGPPKGVADTPDRFERPRKYHFASHAEQNLIAFAARHGVRTAGCAIWCTHMPCSGCARSIIQAGIVAVWYGPGTTSMPAEEFQDAMTMFTEAGVQVNGWPDDALEVFKRDYNV